MFNSMRSLFQLIISIWLNVCAMKLQYYEEIVKSSSAPCLPRDDKDTVDENGDWTQPTIEVETNAKNGARSHQPPSTLTSHEWKLLQIIIVWIIILSTTSLLPVNQDGTKFVIGVAVNLNLIFFYAAPLSTIVVVLRAKNSSSIHPCTMIMNTINSFFWCIYSLAIQDHYILIPNGMGFLFGIVQMILFKCYPQIDVTGEMGTLQLHEEAPFRIECQAELLRDERNEQIFFPLPDSLN